MTDYLPETPAELTADWLQDALGWPIDDVSQEVLGDGQGFMGDILRLHLDSPATDTPASVVAKLPKKANRAMGELMGVYEREILFFQEFAAEVPARVPQIHFSYFDRDAGSEKQAQILATVNRLPLFLTGLVSVLGQRIAASKKRRYLIIMEDLKDFQVGDQLAGATVDFCRQALTAIAPTHRSYWESPKLRNQFWLLPLNIDARMRHGLFRKALPMFRQTAATELLPYIDWLEINGHSLMQQFIADAPETLLHCDLRLDNVCFSNDGCAFIDWQLVRRGPAAYDVAYFLASALSTEVDQATEHALLVDYHRALAVPGYDYAAFARDYQRALLLIVSILATSGTIAIDEGRGQSMMTRWLERLTARLQNIEPAALLSL
jgi:hypothetical protein